MRALSDIEEAETVIRYKLGMSAPRLAEMFGVNEATIRRALDRAEVARRPRQIRSVVSAEVVGQLRTLGWSWGRIARSTGVSPTTARNRMREYERSRT